MRPELIDAVIWQESRGNPRAVSPVGARGLMQVMPDTARSPGFGITPVDPDSLFDPDVNRKFGTQYLGAMVDRYGGDQRRALAAYNWGPGNADKWDGRLESLPSETREYITNIEAKMAANAPVRVADAGGRSAYFDAGMKEDAVSTRQPTGRSAYFDSEMEKENQKQARRAPLGQNLTRESAEAVGGQAAKAASEDDVWSGSGYADGVMRAAMDGFFFGHSDNVGALMGATAGANPKTGGFGEYADTGGIIGGFGKRYRENLAIERRKRAGFEKENPGVDLGAKITGGVVGGVSAAALSPIKAATTMLGRGAQAVGGGAAAGALVGAGEADGPDESRVEGAIKGGAVGAAGGLIGLPVAAVAGRAGRLFGKTVSRIFSGPKLYDAKAGKLTEHGRRRIQNMGLDPDNVTSQLAEAFEKSADAAAKGGGDPARVVPAERFGIPLTKGQATGDVPQIALEENMRAGTRGQAAYDTLSGFDQRQTAAVGRAREGIVPGGDLAASDAAQMAMDGVRREAGAAKQAGQAAYEMFEEAGGGVRGQAIKGLDQRLVQSLRDEGVALNPTTTNANNAVAFMGKMFEGAERGAVPFRRIERTRQGLRRFTTAAMKAGNGADQMAMRNIIGEFDEWLEEAVETALTDGSPEVLARMREARGLWGAYAKTFLGKKGADNYIRKIVEDDLSPDQVVGWLLGASKNIGGGQSALVAKRMRSILGAESDEFSALKKAAFDRITMKGDTMRGPDDMASALREFIHGKGRALSQQLFTPDELTRIREFRMAIDVLRKPPKATNPSGTSYDNQRAVNALFQTLGGALGFGAGGPGGAVAGAAGAKAFSGWRNGLAAKAATAGLRGPAPSIGAAIGFAGGAGGRPDEIAHEAFKSIR